MVRKSVWVVMLASLAACDELDLKEDHRYELLELGNTTYLVDRNEGRVFQRTGDRLVEIQKVDQAQLALVSASRSLIVRPVKGLAFDIRTTYRNGSIYYAIGVQGAVTTQPPAASAGQSTSETNLIDLRWRDYWKQDGNVLFFRFVDAHGIVLHDIAVYLSGASKTAKSVTVDDEDNEIGFRYDGSEKMDLSDYIAIAEVEVHYILERPTVP